MSRSVPEWIGKSDDSQPPPRVKLRVYERHNGLCHITGLPIRPGDPWECDHIVALINNGENRESNLAPALLWAHQEKTDEDMAIKSKTASIRKRHLGITKPKRGFLTNKNGPFKKKMDGTIERR